VTGVLAVALAGCAEASHHALVSEGSTQSYRPAPLGAHVLQHTTGLPCTAGVRLSAKAEPSYAAVVHQVADAYAQPGSRFLNRFRQIDQNGYPTVFGVLGVRFGVDCKPTWFRVQLPVPPNGSTGWVSASTVHVYPVLTRILVHLSTRRLVVYLSGREVFRAPVAIGAARTPTPEGRFFVNERFLLNSSGPFGVAALGISAHSDVLKNWVQGGPIALHGTDDPASIGSATTHGCIRLLNGDMHRLFALAPAGTPVTILR